MFVRKVTIEEANNADYTAWLGYKVYSIGEDDVGGDSQSVRQSKICTSLRTSLASRENRHFCLQIMNRMCESVETIRVFYIGKISYIKLTNQTTFCCLQCWYTASYFQEYKIF